MGTLAIPGGAPAPESIGFLGPAGTFTEEALRSQADLAGARLVPLPSFVAVLDAVAAGDVDAGFVAVENSIEGTVPVTLDQLVFEQELVIHREVVRPVTQNLIGVPGAATAGITRVTSFPHATAQCRAWLTAHLPDARVEAATSTAEAVRSVSESGDPTSAAVGTALAASLYDLEVLAAGIEDHPDNATRFLLVAPFRQGVAAPTGHDRTSIVCFQHADHPGSLHGILGQFSARDINLVKLESRPTKSRLGDYCFVIDFEGHVADEVVADCLRDLYATLPTVKFLGSYPASGDTAPARRLDADESRRAARSWVAGLQGRIHPPTVP